MYDLDTDVRGIPLPKSTAFSYLILSLTLCDQFFLSEWAFFDMTTLGLPYFLEDTTGHVSGPTDFLDVYERPPFLRVESTILQGQSYRREIVILELNAGGSQRREARRPVAVVSFHGIGLRGSVRFQSGLVVQLDRWLKKSTTFGSTLTRKFKATDGFYYQWSFGRPREREWVCVQMGTDHLVAHYDVRPTEGLPVRMSGSVLTIYPNWIHLAVELLASLAVMRHIHAHVSED